MAKLIKQISKNGRFRITADLHKQLGEDIVVTNGLDKGYLCIYSAERFENSKKQLYKLNTIDPRVRKLMRCVIGEAERTSINAKHEICVSTELWRRIGAKGGDTICIVSYDDKLEVCLKTLYDDLDLHLDDDLSSLFCITDL